MHTKSGQTGSIPEKIQVILCTKPDTENLILYNINVRRTTVTCYAHNNSKLGKNSRRELGADVVHSPKLHVEKKTSHVQLC